MKVPGKYLCLYIRQKSYTVRNLTISYSQGEVPTGFKGIAKKAAKNAALE
jgi:hypothetical protein